jgi:DNA-binding NarL/FixJ family response regulator
MRTRVLLADQETLLRQGVRLLLERRGYTVVAEASDGREATELVREHRPEVVIFDLVMPPTNGLQTMREIQSVCPSVRVILLTMLIDDRLVLEALQSGARGYVLKTEPVETLVQAIREAQGGGIYLSPHGSRAIFQAGRAVRALAHDTLSARESEVLQLVAAGKSTKQIAAALNISVKTADFHRMRLMKKLNIHETAGLVRYAIRKGLTPP